VSEKEPVFARPEKGRIQYLQPKQEKTQKYFGGFTENAIFALAIKQGTCLFGCK
jgi:hypothetical protein